MVVVEGFELPSSSQSNNEEVPGGITGIVASKKKGGGGGFQSMGLSSAMFKGVMKKGYELPSPIQRKSIPLIMEGHDVVAMARTGSGKTAAFLIPMFEKLKSHSAVPGARALILSPTRELALQTLKFTRELGCYHDLKAAVVLGGDSFENQFSALHEGPDVILATPGRFMHVCMEMSLKLDKVEYVVFDEADRLFEMGFHEQLLEIIKRLPEDRQTLLFSATLPKVLVDFSKAGLSDPKLVRLDVENKLSAQLKLATIKCQSEDKPALLLHLLQKVIAPHQQTVVFCATRHHVEFLQLLLQLQGISNTYIYSSMDQAARVKNTENFRCKKTHVLLVTDLAARGIDIPLLDNVINYNFPAKPKLFVHRVGRVARAGRTGTAYSLVNVDEMPYVMDLHLFLGLRVKWVPATGTTPDQHGWIGTVDYTTLEDNNEYITRLLEDNYELHKAKKSSINGYKQYLKSRGQSSKESRARYKEEKHREIGIHPVLLDAAEEYQGERNKILHDIKNYKSKQTIFEFGVKIGDAALATMKRKRRADEKTIYKHKNKKAAVEPQEPEDTTPVCSLEASTEDDLTSLIESTEKSKKKKQENFKDEKFYIPHYAPDHHSERGLAMGGSFVREANAAVVSFTADDDQLMRKQKQQLKWDKKKKKFVHEGQDKKKRKVRTESGVLIPASYKTDKYSKWRERNKVDHVAAEGEGDGDDDGEGRKKPGSVYGRNSWKNAKGKRGITVLNGRNKPGAKVNPEKAWSKKKTNPRKERKSSDQVISKRAQKIEKQIRTLKASEAKQRKRAKGRKK